MKFFIISIVIIILALIFGFFFFNKPDSQILQLPASTSPPIQNEEVNEKVNIKATFAIITGNITRSFKAEKYHNKSPDVYIENPDPSIISVKNSGITWDDFFQTLPMKLTKDCLITGDGETLCTGEEGTLEFYLNEVETPNLLDKEIKEGDQAVIKWSV